MAPDIPGYYYDPDKRRYFKIENSKTAPTQAVWSSDNVKRRRIESGETALALRHLNISKRRIARSRTLNEPLTGGFFATECGRAASDLLEVCFAKGIVEKGQLPLADARWVSGSNVKHLYVGGQDHKTGVCTAYATLDELTLISTYLPRDKNGRMHRRLLADYVAPSSHITPYQELAVPQISDIKYHEPSNKFLITSRSPGTEVSMWVFSPKTTEPGDRRPHWLLGWDGVALFMNLKLNGDGRFNDYQANCVTPAPAGSSMNCVIGTSRGLAKWDDTGDLKWVFPVGPRQYCMYANTFRDVFAMDFRHDHPDVLLFGGRPGKLFTGDMRIRCDKWDHIKLPGPVTHIKSLNRHQTLVSCLKNHLSVYDHRFFSQPRDRENKKGKASTGDNSPTPVQVFPQYKNGAHINIGLDYDSAMGIVAAAHDDGRVALYSVRSGRRLQNPDIDGIRATYGPINSIQFQTFPGDLTPTLFVGVGSNINAYSFGIETLGDEA